MLRFEGWQANRAGWEVRGHRKDELERYILPEPGHTSVLLLIISLTIFLSNTLINEVGKTDEVTLLSALELKILPLPFNVD